MDVKNEVLYLSYTGMLEPLGRSQVLNYLSRLSRDYSFTLVSFEKPHNMSDKAAVLAMHNECGRHGITWKPQTYHHRPRLLATAWDLLVLLWLTLLHSAWRDVRLVHCRSYIPAMAAWLCGKVTRKPFIFDMRALWPDEMVSAGRLQKSSTIYRLLKKLEYKLLRDAKAVVSLTEAAAKYFMQLYPNLNSEKFHVITTCVDLSRFSSAEKQPITKNEQFTFGSMGTVLNGWYRLDWLFLFYAEIRKHFPNAILKIVTKDNHATIQHKAEDFGLQKENLKLLSCQPHEIQNHISDFDAAALFFVSDIGKLGSAPTRLGEFLAAGIPVVGNHGIGDMGGLIDRFDVGVTISGEEVKIFTDAVDRFLDFLENRYSPDVCRNAAESYFSADNGADRYRSIYRHIHPQQPVVSQ